MNGLRTNRGALLLDLSGSVCFSYPLWLVRPPVDGAWHGAHCEWLYGEGAGPVGTYFSCLAPDELVRLCLVCFFGSLFSALVCHLGAQLLKLLFCLLIREGFDLE